MWWVTLTENTPPALSAVGGGAWGGGVISGSSAAVTFAATDASGIRGAVVSSEAGQTLGLLAQACDDTPAGAVWAPAGRGDQRRRGPHTLSLAVSDSAQNTTTVSSPVIVIDNDGPAAPVGLTASAAAGSRTIARALA